MATSAGLLVSLRLAGKRVLVVGGSQEAESRVFHALECGAIVTVLAPGASLTPVLKRRIATNQVSHVDSEFAGVEDLYLCEDLDHNDNPTTYHLVLGCLDGHDESVDLCECARALKIPVNCADVPELCDFFFVAVMREGLLQIGVSTNGGGPRLAARLRTHIQNTLPKGTKEAVSKIAALRLRVKNTPTPPGAGGLVKKRMGWMSRLCDSWSFEEMSNLNEEEVLRVLGAYERGEETPPLPSIKMEYPESKQIISTAANELRLPLSSILTRIPTVKQVVDAPISSFKDLAGLTLALWLHIITYPLRVTFSLLESAFPGLKTWTPPPIVVVRENSRIAPTSIPTDPPTPATIQIPHLPPPQTPQITLVGAGPGNPSYLTISALQHVAAADAIVTDTLVSPDILRHASTACKLLTVPKKVNGQSDAAQDAANEMCVDVVRGGARRVVRLKGGDPYVFGRGGEEMKYFAERGVKAVVVPGVSNINGSLVSAGIPATYKGVSEQVVVVSARGEKGAWPEIPVFGEGMKTVLVFMPIARMQGIAELMISKGYPACLPAAIIENGTLENQRVIHGTLENMGKLVVQEKVVSPALLVVGNVCTVLQDI